MGKLKWLGSLGLVVSLLGLVGCSSDVSITKDLTLYIDEQLQTKNEVTLKVEDAAVNNPKCEQSITATVDTPDGTKFLQIDIGKLTKSAYPAQGDALFYVDEENPITYVTEKNKEGFSQYVVIRKEQERTESVGEWDKYVTYKCKLCLNNVGFGSNDNGKFQPIPSMKVGD